MKLRILTVPGLDWTNNLHRHDYNRSGLSAFRCLETSSPKTKNKNRIKMEVRQPRAPYRVTPSGAWFAAGIPKLD